MSLISSHGYVKIFVGYNKHLADSKGYAYEHRMVAEQILGRQLKRGEIVHHLDGNKTNNNPDNLNILPSIRHHLFYHRYSKKQRRKPDEDNPIIFCLCGCGASFTKYDNFGRLRKYVSGHNRNKIGGRYEH